MFAVYDISEQWIPFYIEINHSFNFTISEDELTEVSIRAKGDLAGPDLPQMRVSMDGNILDTHDVSGTWAYYNSTVQLSKGKHTLTIAYINDYKRKEPPTKETAPKTEDSQVKKAGDNQGKTKSENYPEKKPGNSEKARKTEKKN